MVPLMVATPVVVVASQISGVGARLSSLVTVLPLFVIFAGVMVPIGMLVSRVAGLETSGRRAVVFSGATRNSLVVLPLVLALPAAFDLSPLVVLIRLVPRLLPESKSSSAMRDHR